MAFVATVLQYKAAFPVEKNPWDCHSERIMEEILDFDDFLRDRYMLMPEEYHSEESLTNTLLFSHFPSLKR